jgi:molybdate transport system ATP-binding protein
MSLSVDLRLAHPGFSLNLCHDFAATGVTAVFGPSGAGKSTLLRAIAGLEPLAKGRVSFGETAWQAAEKFMPPEQRGVGYVFQDARLFPHLRVRGNLAYADRRARGLPGMSFEQVVARFDLADLLHRWPLSLSGGERQRVALARALLSRPRLLLLDEPLAALDLARKAEILPYLAQLSDLGLPVIYVTHAVEEVAQLADHLVLMQAGRVVAAGPVAGLLADPALTARLGAGLGARIAGAVLTAHILAHHADGLSELTLGAERLWVPRLAQAPGSAVRLRIPAEDVILAKMPPAEVSALNVLPVLVCALHPLPDGGVAVGLQAGEAALVARLTARSVAALELRPGMQVWAMMKAVALGV